MNITDIARIFIGGVRIVGPVLVVLAVVAIVVELTTRSGRARLTLAHYGLSEVQPSVLRRLLAGTLVPILGVAALCVSLSLEQEVREGPNRMVDRLRAAAGPDEPAWILQRGSDHFMNDSRLPQAVVDAAAADRSEGIHALYEQLVTVQAGAASPDTGLLLGIPREDPRSPFSPTIVPATARCEVSPQGTCRLRSGQAIADESVYPVGTRLQVRGAELTVVANTQSPYSLINRTVVFTTEAAFRREDGVLEAPYALVVGGPGALERASAIAAASGAAEAVDVVTAEQIKRSNADFWAGNGTPLLLLVICLSAAFCGVALYAARRALHRRERMSTGTLQAMGLRIVEVCRIDLLRAVLGTLVAAVLAAPIAYVILKVVNAGMLGFHATLTPLFVASAAGLLIFASVLGTLMMLVRVRSLSVVEAISEP